MDRDSHIEISLEYNDNQLDFLIPINIMMKDLRELINKTLKENGVFLPEIWIMRLRDKRINIGDYDYLDEFPVGNGDVFEIMARKTDDERFSKL